MSDVYIVLGMHRTGTSLVSSMLHVGGVEMCRWNCGQGSISQENGYFEDRGARALNDLILYKAGGDWRSPPHGDKVDSEGCEFHNAMAAQIRVRAVNRERWGFKDPRTILTVSHWHTLLSFYQHNQHYIFTQRNTDATVASLLLRHKKSRAAEWINLIRYYNQLMQDWRAFLNNEGIPFINISYDKLVGGRTAYEVNKLSEFSGCEDMLLQMTGRVKRRPLDGSTSSV